MQITLKVDVDTYRGTLEGVPALLSLLARYGVRATFLFSVGPDNTGRAIRRVFRRGFLGKVKRTSVTEHYGFKTLTYGVLLPGPHIGRRAGQVMREVAAQGHEVGTHAYDHVRWQDNVARRDEAWTRREMQRAWDAFADALGSEPETTGAAGWQINKYVLPLQSELGYTYASDVRGQVPFLPTMDGVNGDCVQLPTTLPTLDELIGVDDVTADNVHEMVIAAAREPLATGHVYTLHAELEGMKLLSVMDRLLANWQAEGVPIGTMGDLYRSLDRNSLPRRQIAWGEVPGRSGSLAVEQV